MARIARLSVAGIRNLAEVSLSPHPRMTLIVGDNGAGKTALLESIHLLATGRSFRDARVQRCVQWQSITSTIFRS